MELSILRALAVRLRRLGASRRESRDILLGACGFKASRLLLTDLGVAALAEIAEAYRLHLSVSEYSFHLTEDDAIVGFSNLMTIDHDGRCGRREVFLSTDDRVTVLLEKRRNDHRFIGSHLRIPACCIDFYYAAASDAGARQYDYLTLTKLPSAPSAPAFNNTIARYFDRGLLDHFPCRHDCGRSHAIAVDAFRVLMALDVTLARELVAEGTFLHHESSGVFWLRGDNHNGWSLLEALSRGGLSVALTDTASSSIEILDAAIRISGEVFSPVHVVTFAMTPPERAVYGESG